MERLSCGPAGGGCGDLCEHPLVLKWWALRQNCIPNHLPQQEQSQSLLPFYPEDDQHVDKLIDCQITTILICKHVLNFRDSQGLTTIIECLYTNFDFSKYSLLAFPPFLTFLVFNEFLTASQIKRRLWVTP